MALYHLWFQICKCWPAADVMQQLIELTAIQYSEHFQRSAVMTRTAPRAAYLAASANDPREESRSFAADTATAWCS